MCRAVFFYFLNVLILPIALDVVISAEKTMAGDIQQEASLNKLRILEKMVLPGRVWVFRFYVYKKKKRGSSLHCTFGSSRSAQGDRIGDPGRSTEKGNLIETNCKPL